MSFSSSINRSPQKRKQHAQTFSEALYELGFEPARTQNYDWMAAYPDAVPLLEAIRTNVDPPAVLSVSEMEQLKSVRLSYKKVSPSDIVEAAQPLVNAPFLKDAASARETQLTSARNRVKLLKLQKEALLDAVRQRQDESKSPHPALRSRSNRVTIHAKAAKLRSTAEVLKQYVGQDLDIFRHDLDMIRYCDVEEKHSETIATVFTQGFRDDLKTSYNHQAKITSRAKKAINAYANLKQMQCMYRALVIRDAAMIASLGVKDDRYLEMTASSMVSLIKELRSNAAKAMQLKANQVSEEARESLQHDINLLSLSERARQQKAYIEAIRQCISLYLEQRVRIHCLQAVTNRVTDQRGRILNLLRAISPDLTSLTIDEKGTPNACVTYDEDETNSSASPSDAKVKQGACEICKNDKFALEHLENKVFWTHVERVASQISSVTRNTGDSSSWLRLSCYPKRDILIKELEDELGKNTTVLEALLQKKAAIVDKASSPSQSHSPSRSWISRITASHSPKHSSYSSNSSR